MANSIKARQTIQRWGDGLCVQITTPVARAARFTRGRPITVAVVNGGVLLRPVGKPQLTLAQKPKAFDPRIHGGEAMVSGRVGAERL